MSDPRPIIDVISSHPWVGRARHTGDEVVVRPHADAVAVRPVLGDLVREHLEHWSEVYEWIYLTSDGQPPEADLSGWRASDTGEPLPREHMLEWIDRTVELVREGNPRCVLELGCGTGLLLRRLCTDVEHYVGTDVSEAAVERLTAAGLPGVSVVLAAAHESGSSQVVTALAGRRPDCVLINSVTQCFPGRDYLDAVVSDALAVVADGGRVIIGDFRHAGLAGRYYRWLSSDDQDAARRAAADEEFVFDPKLLAEIATRCERPVTMSVRAKTMTADTELTRYRCDVVLHVAPPAVPAGGGETPLPNALLCDDPGGVAPHVLRERIAGTGAIVGLDLDDPTRLRVCAPSGDPVDLIPPAGPAPADPIVRFVAGRLAEAVRDHLARVRPGEPQPAVRVEWDGTR
ncbi:class I SAM-dependent methyltransferase [Lentzea aerocolonigenes]|uniref:class I SAM-dependent methyltransferase n=1 Tax=Lentzea aerocolonigenes TaxID=68170 RepID=UPI0005ECCB03|nr:class I SAM-dependent methyltransferase [Lentzea aerocolonigenes]